MIEEYGPHAVRIDGVVVPAQNIQVDGYPRVIDGHQYFVYFEIMFEHGARWVVEKYDSGEDDYESAIFVDEFNRWDLIDEYIVQYMPDRISGYSSWIGFLKAYKEEAKARV